MSGHFISEYDEVTEVTAFDQTPRGYWYPRSLRRSHPSVDRGRRYPGQFTRIDIELDTSTPVSDELLTWPADLPVPE